MKKKPEVYKAPSVEEYMKMSPADKRITIARDIIASLNSQIYIGTTGHYIKSFRVNNEYISNGRWNDWEVQGYTTDTTKDERMPGMCYGCLCTKSDQI